MSVPTRVASHPHPQGQDAWHLLPQDPGRHRVLRPESAARPRGLPSGLAAFTCRDAFETHRTAVRGSVLSSPRGVPSCRCSTECSSSHSLRDGHTAASGIGWLWSHHGGHSQAGVTGTLVFVRATARRRAPGSVVTVRVTFYERVTLPSRGAVPPLTATGWTWAFLLSSVLANTGSVRAFILAVLTGVMHGGSSWCGSAFPAGLVAPAPRYSPRVL